MKNTFDITLLVVLWGLTALGFVFNIFFTVKWNIILTIVYIVIGCIQVEAEELSSALFPAD